LCLCKEIIFPCASQEKTSDVMWMKTSGKQEFSSITCDLVVLCTVWCVVSFWSRDVILGHIFYSLNVTSHKRSKIPFLFKSWSHRKTWKSHKTWGHYHHTCICGNNNEVIYFFIFILCPQHDIQSKVFQRDVWFMCQTCFVSSAKMVD